MRNSSLEGAPVVGGSWDLKRGCLDGMRGRRARERPRRVGRQPSAAGRDAVGPGLAWGGRI